MKNIKIDKSPHVKKLIMSMLNVLEAVGIPIESKSDKTKVRIAEAVLAVAGIKKSFAEAISSDEKKFLTTRQIIDYENKYLEGKYSPGSYDDIRRHHLIMLTTAGYVVNSSQLDIQSTNNPTRGYATSPIFTELLRSYGTIYWSNTLELFKQKNKELKEQLARKRELERIPVILPSGVEIRLSAGEHNELQRDIIQQFLPRFGFGSEVLYLGDTTDKYLIREDEKLKVLNFFELEHEELPDVVAYSQEKNLLFLIEAVHSFGQMNEIRVKKLKDKLKDCPAHLVFVSAFENKKIFRKFSEDIAWESEVWISDNPDHMIHFNGYKFLEIHK
ncbi:MAG: hypothetical protein IJT97_04310 [Bacteroidaceae bacterium]|nr:hypothetical protein [Bacteroidaceae bacterium]